MAETNEAIRDEVAAFWLAGLSAGQIAARMGMTRSAVLGHVHRARAKGDRRFIARPSSNDTRAAKWSDAADRQLLALRAQGRHSVEISLEMGLSRSQVDRRLVQLRGQGVWVPPLPAPPRPQKAAEKPKVPKAKPRVSGPDATEALLAGLAERPFGPLLPLEHNTGCKWSFGHPGSDGFGFCGAERLEGRPWCAAHAARAVTRLAPGAAPRSKPLRLVTRQAARLFRAQMEAGGAVGLARSDSEKREVNA